MGSSTWLRMTSGVVLSAMLLLAAPPMRAADDVGIPTDGLDRVLLVDGRILRCKVGATLGGNVTLSFPSGDVSVGAGTILQIRKFADYDSTPRDPAEQAKVEQGLVRWNGKWIQKAKAEAERKVLEQEQAALAAEDAKHAIWDSRRIVESDHFRFESDIPKRDLDEYIVMMESFYDYFTRAFKITLTQRERRKKLPVYLFRKRDDFRKYHQIDTGGKSEHLLGYFVPAIGQERLVFFDVAGNRAETIDVMFHETTHFLIHLAEPKILVSRWVHEGMAEYIGKSRVEGKRFVPGGIQDDRLLNFQEMLNSGKTVPMDEFLKAGNPAPTGAHIEFEGEHYAQTWTMVHFFMEGKKGKYRAAFLGFLERMMTGRGAKMTPISGSEQSFMDFEEQKAQLLRTLGMKDWAPLEKELKEYAMELPLADARAYVRRGEIRYYNRSDAEGAMKDWDTAHERGKDDARVLADLSRVYSYVPERSPEVVPLLRRALELDPLNVTYRFRLSRYLPEEALPQLRLCVEIDPHHSDSLNDLAWRSYLALADRDRAQSEEDLALAGDAEVMAARAIEREPTADAYFTLASLQLSLGKFKEAREAAKIAVELDPESEVYLLRLAESCALLGDAPEFAKLLRRVELLMRRDSQLPEGATASEENAPRSPEEIRSLINEWLRERVAVRCDRFELREEAALAAGSWFERRPPSTEEDWIFYAGVVHYSGDKKRSTRIALDGLKLFPESEVLKTFLTEEGL